MTGKVADLKREGRGIIGLGAGEPDFDTPENIKVAANAAINDGQTKYTPIPGTLALREAICEKFIRDNGLRYTEQVIVVWRKAGNINAFVATLDPGDDYYSSTLLGVLPRHGFASRGDAVFVTGHEKWI